MNFNSPGKLPGISHTHFSRSGCGDARAGPWICVLSLAGVSSLLVLSFCGWFETGNFLAKFSSSTVEFQKVYGFLFSPAHSDTLSAILCVLTTLIFLPSPLVKYKSRSWRVSTG